MITSIITADIINSRQEQAKNWLKTLKEVLSQYGETPKNWEVFRGDSFQLEVSKENAFLAAIHIKSTIRQFHPLDIRVAIGIGNKTYDAHKVTESNGEAFVRSGETFDSLKNHRLGISTGDSETDEEIQLYFDLAALTTDSWTAFESLVVKTTIENPTSNQSEIAHKLSKHQSSISKALKRSGHEQIMKIHQRFQKLMNRL